MKVSATTKNICIYIEIDCIHAKEWLIVNDWNPEGKEAAEQKGLWWLPFSSPA